MTHEHFLKIALEKAWLGRGLCAPNPSVGAVAVRGDHILSEGWHQGPGTPHAEVMALSQLPPDLSDVTLYVTLEPCNHWGRTPPCTDVIESYGVKRVVYGFQDPNPIVANNQTPQLLKERGVEVIYCPLPEMTAFYESYAYWLRTKRPWVSVKMAQSLDGKIADAEKKPLKISNDACAEFTHFQRLHTDVILTTAKTILADKPLLNARIKGKTVAKTLAIVDRQLSLPDDLDVFQMMKQAYVFYDKTLAEPVLKANCEYIKTQTAASGLSIEDILTFLGTKGMHDVWVEAGSQLCHTLHVLGLVQRTYLYVAPVVLGQDAYSLYQDKTVFQRQHSVSWRVLDDDAVLTIDW
ncbi:MAG: bifunctional diaminohydroxyphosphoribosylaminopyrimidine deaminase/5-amino-6-(5-phosphoribosylamino)uracil reductase RibD [Gammaproteobacteria bacterium]|nr:bifunctional diaminohydroxyphosphoribosylaminopyrimidine deaminase/5-amino-6-(5-phosphoribosylamino)uracil reductase RibD [Gammaproteobacteria bacterium]